MFELSEIIKTEKFKDTKEEIRIRKSKKDRQHNDQRKKDKQRSIKHTYKTKDRLTRTPLKTGVDSGALEGFLLHYWPPSC